MESIGKVAEEYVRLGLAVIPLKPNDKPPAIKDWQHNAFKTVNEVRSWWGRSPNSNLGIATGKQSGGLVVIDIDDNEAKGKYGYETLREWEREHGELPITVSTLTGSGGYHLYYRTDKPISCHANADLWVDIRGEGGQVVAYPSIHPDTGHRYEWENDPTEYEIAEADDNVLAFIEYVSGGEDEREKFVMPEKIADGKRNDTIFKLACSLQSTGLSDEVIKSVCQEENESKCNPPLSDAEMRKILSSALKYDKGKSIAKRPDDGLIRNKNGAPKQLIHNYMYVIETDPGLKGRFFYDVRSHTKMVQLPLPWDDGKGVRPVTDADYACLGAYTEAVYGLDQKSKAIDAVLTRTITNKRNTLAELLDSLEWDGERRMDTLLTMFLGAKDTGYNRAVMRLFMLGAVARAYVPGTKFDVMPVLVGKQGIGKSMFLRKLSMDPDWYCDNLNTIEGDAAAEKLRGMWIVEMAELLAVKRQKDVEAIKAFVTSQVDTIRPKYARETEQRPRGCVFAGTTNNPQFLTDSTGNRRFLPITCGYAEPLLSLFDEEADEYIEQAWAEAVHVWKTEHPRLVLPKECEEEAERHQEAYLEDDPRVGMIQAYLDEKLNRWNLTSEDERDELHVRVCVVELIDEALKGNDSAKGNRFLINEIHTIMRNKIKGWVIYPMNEGRARTLSYGIQRCYVPENV